MMQMAASLFEQMYEQADCLVGVYTLEGASSAVTLQTTSVAGNC